MARSLTITRRNATFQQWHSMLTNRSKRQRSGEFLIQGVRPIDQALAQDWPIRWILYDRSRALSSWADAVLERFDQRAALGPDLMAELGEKPDSPPELLMIAAIPEDDLGRMKADRRLLVVALDRPSSPGNLGSIIRSADALGSSGVIVTGHAADPYDPRAVRASTGSIFSVPVVRLDGPRQVADWADHLRDGGVEPAVVGTDEHGDTAIWDHNFTGPTIVAIGNETAGLSNTWREICDRTVRIPMGGSASSLNAANAATVVLYEATRQRAGTQSVKPASA